MTAIDGLPPHGVLCSEDGCTAPAEIQSTLSLLWFCVAHAPPPRENAAGRAEW